jgi:hypothetical protein
MAQTIINPSPSPPPDPYEHRYIPDNSGAVSIFPIYSRRVGSSEEPIPLVRDRLINIDYEKVTRDIEEFRRMGYIPLAELTMDWVAFIAEHLYGKSNNYIRAFMNRYIITDPLISRGHEQRLRTILLQILKDTVTQNSLEDAKVFIVGSWDIYITPKEDNSNNEFLVLFLDTEALHRMVLNGVVYNKKGFVKASPRRDSMSSRRASSMRRRRARRARSVSHTIYASGRKHRKRTTRKKK